MKNVIYVYGASYCQPCKELIKRLDKSEIDYRYVDVDDYCELAKKYKIMRLPTIIVFDENDKEIYRNIGGNKIFELLQYVRE